MCLQRKQWNYSADAADIRYYAFNNIIWKLRIIPHPILQKYCYKLLITIAMTYIEKWFMFIDGKINAFIASNL